MLSALDRVEFARSIDFEPDPWQRDLLQSEHPRVLLNCSRQSGKSSTAAILALHQALTYPESLVLALAPALRQSQELFQKIGDYYSDLGMPMRHYGERRLSLELTNGSRIITLPGSEKTVRGFSGASLLILDEASRIEDELYFAIRPMLAVSGGRLMMLSTPFGKRGVFYEAWMSGRDWERYKVPASMCPRITEEFLEEERIALGDYFYRQEYLCSFEDLPDVFMTEEEVENMITDKYKPLQMPPMKLPPPREVA